MGLRESGVRIVVAGGGAGGLELVVALAHRVRRNRLATVTLIDPAPAHFWKPRLHEVAAGLIDAADQERGYAGLAAQHGFSFVRGAMAELSSEGVVGLTNGATVGFDYLVLAIGSTVNDFGTPGVAAHAAMLDSVAQAARIHDCFVEQARISRPGAAPALKVAIVGAGATGVELAAELRNAVQLAPAYRRLREADGLSITVIDMADRVLPTLEPDISRYAANRLTEQGTRLILGQRVTEVTETAVHLADGQVVQADVTVWASGVKGPDILADCPPLRLARDGRVVVDETLLCEGTTNIFALGDCAALTQAGKVVPPTAQAAHQQAQFLAKSLPRRLRGQLPGRFTYRYRGTIVAFGRSGAIGEIGAIGVASGIRLRGLAAKFAYMSLYLEHLGIVYGWPTGMAMLLGLPAGPHAASLPLKLHDIG